MPSGLLSWQGRVCKRLGLGIAALRLVEQREVIQTGGDMRVLRTERLLADGEGAFVQRLGLGVAALRPVEHREILRDGWRLRMLGPSAFSAMARARLYKGSASA